METAVFGMPLSTFLTVTCVPIVIAAGLVLWGLTYSPSDDEPNKTQ